MKITQEQLRKIVKEELVKELYYDPDPLAQARQSMGDTAVSMDKTQAAVERGDASRAREKARTVALGASGIKEHMQKVKPENKQDFIDLMVFAVGKLGYEENAEVLKQELTS